MACCLPAPSHCLNRCWFINALYHHHPAQISQSTLAQAMACCLTAPSHCLNQWNLLIYVPHGTNPSCAVYHPCHHHHPHISVNIGSGNGLLPDGTKPSPEPMLIYVPHGINPSCAVYSPVISTLLPIWTTTGCQGLQQPASQPISQHIAGMHLQVTMATHPTLDGSYLSSTWWSAWGKCHHCPMVRDRISLWGYLTVRNDCLIHTARFKKHVVYVFNVTLVHKS